MPALLLRQARQALGHSRRYAKASSRRQRVRARIIRDVVDETRSGLTASRIWSTQSSGFA